MHPKTREVIALVKKKAFSLVEACISNEDQRQSGIRKRGSVSDGGGACGPGNDNAISQKSD